MNGPKETTHANAGDHANCVQFSFCWSNQNTMEGYQMNVFIPNLSYAVTPSLLQAYALKRG